MLENYKNKFISFYEKHKRMPGYKEIMALTGFKSKNAVYKLINKLVEEGVVGKDKQGKLTPRTIFGEIPMAGVVEAGFPTPAEETNLDRVTLDEWLIGDRNSTFILKVKGESMKDAGIYEGDYVLVERTQNAKIGEIVIAEVDGSWTMKYFRRDKDGYYLEPANLSFQNIRPENDLNISAVVKAVVRKYK
ncbi:MAG: S24 family peptidase [Patescibacteria group bacterium]